MMNKIRVLIEGYAKEIKGGWLASSTTTLIESRGKFILVDPGTNRELLLEKLKQNNLAVSDIDFVFMTHYHPDHNLLSGIFPNSKILDDELVYENDSQVEHHGVIPGTDIKIISTSGHDQFHGSLVVPTREGIFVVAGDVFWWDDKEKQEVDDGNALVNKEDPFVKDKKSLRISREKVLEIADWVIPGHGKMFRNPKKKIRG